MGLGQQNTPFNQYNEMIISHIILQSESVNCVNVNLVISNESATPRIRTREVVEKLTLQ